MTPREGAARRLNASRDKSRTLPLERTGPWSLFKLLEAGGLTVRAETASAQFLFQGQELHYQITTSSIKNPLDLATLRRFECPSNI